MTMRHTSLRPAISAGLLATLLFAPTLQAAPVYGGKIEVASDGHVIATYRGGESLFLNHLYLDSPGNSLGLLFTENYCYPSDCGTPVGTTIDLGWFSAGTELVFRMDSRQFSAWEGGTPLPPEEAPYTWLYQWYTGPAERNADGYVHSYVDDAVHAGEVFVAFEDWPHPYFGNNDRDFLNGMFSLSNTAVVPVPAALPLFGSALGLIAFLRRRRTA